MFQKPARPPGRPRGFDEREALQQATQLFWSKGFDGTTIDELVAGMGVGRPSLYSVFGDKRTLFLRVLKTYAEQKGALATEALLTPSTLRGALDGLLRYVVESATEDRSAAGCLLVCVAPLVDDDEVRQFLENSAAATVALVERRFLDGVGAGEIPLDFPAASRARLVLDLCRGLTMRAQMGASRQALLKDAEDAADLILMPRPEGR
jgi:AcrR family transcriptional regulator